MSKLSHYPDLGVSAIATVTCVGVETLRAVTCEPRTEPGGWEHGAGGQCQEGEEPCVQTQERDISGNSEQIKSQGEPRSGINTVFIGCCNDH